MSVGIGGSLEPFAVVCMHSVIRVVGVTAIRSSEEPGYPISRAMHDRRAGGKIVS